ncbi:DUF1045 domain-containing protein [Candidatus Saccharibacteria bacterium]|nr:DUF1045 domain-containing protein [Candidatus Saccharibacteria bacterium]
MLQLKLDDIVTAEKDLKIIASNFKIFQLQAIKYSQDEGFVDVEYKKLSSLTFLQEKVLAIFNSMRDGMREKDRARLATTEGLARENLQQYGYRGIGELFRPHLTLTRFSNKNEQQLTNMPKIDSFSGSFDRIGLFEMGESGTCRRKIFEIKLK